MFFYTFIHILPYFIHNSIIHSPLFFHDDQSGGACLISLMLLSVVCSPAYAAERGNFLADLSGRSTNGGDLDRQSGGDGPAPAGYP